MSNAPDPRETQAFPSGDAEPTRLAPDTPSDGGESLLQPGDQIPGYEIFDILGRGGMGVVYRARQTALDRFVAIKTVLLSQQMRADAVARFEKEARTVARFRHPNIVTAYDFGRHEGRLFFVMELLEGETLEEHVALRGRVEESLAWGLVRQVAAGLAHAAQMGIVHRDVKPANLFLVEPPAGSMLPGGLPMVKITDFGLVLLAADAAASSRLTAVGTALGTPVYMAPEQFSGGEVDQRADIYALGATAFHLLDGQPPFDATTLWQLISQKTKDGPPRLDELSAKISPASVELLAAMMAHDPSTRLRGYEELLQRIDRLPALLANTVPRFEAKTMPVPVASPTKTSPTSKRRRWYVAALIALLLLVAAGVLAGHWLPDFFAFRPLRPMMVASGNVQNLFDGVSLNGWQILAGSWTPARDTDKSNVLTGRGIIRRSLPSWPNYRVSFGIDLHHATSVDVLFGLTSGNSISPAGLALRLSPREVFLARRSKDGAEMEPLSPTLTLSASSDSDDGPVYREVRLERQGIAWWVYYDQKLVGSLPVVESEFTDFRLMVEPGPAIFVDIEVVELVQPQRE